MYIARLYKHCILLMYISIDWETEAGGSPIPDYPEPHRESQAGFVLLLYFVCFFFKEGGGSMLISQRSRNCKFKIILSSQL